MPTETGAIRDLRMLLAELKKEQADHRVECLGVRREANTAQLKTNETLATLTTKIDNIEKLPMRAVKWLGGIVVVAAITNIVTTYLTHEETAQKAQQAAASAQQAVAGQQQTLAVVKSIKATQNATQPAP